MTTVVIQIGNSDDKLTQQQWSDFVGETDRCVRLYAKSVHFMGCSSGEKPWQNACWVFEMATPFLMRDRLSNLAFRYQQESIAMTEGVTEFVSSPT